MPEPLDAAAASGLPRMERTAPSLVRQSCGRRWHVIETQPGKGHIAEYVLSRDGWKIFQPMHLHRTRGHPDRIVPLFLGYLFACWAPGADWPRIARSPYVSRILGCGQPQPVPEGIVEGLQARTSPRRIVDDPLSVPTLHTPGSRLGLRAAPLEGVCQAASAERVTLLLQLLGREVEVSVRPDQVVEI